MSLMATALLRSPGGSPRGFSFVEPIAGLLRIGSMNRKVEMCHERARACEEQASKEANLSNKQAWMIAKDCWLLLAAQAETRPRSHGEVSPN
jgi:hypothetical protein